MKTERQRKREKERERKAEQRHNRQAGEQKVETEFSESCRHGADFCPSGRQRPDAARPGRYKGRREGRGREGKGREERGRERGKSVFQPSGRLKNKMVVGNSVIFMKNIFVGSF